MKYIGSCLCGEVTFEVEGDFQNFYLCHCEYCRKDTGSAHAANLFSSTAKLRWVSGEKKVKTYRFKSTNHIKSFCYNCGSALPHTQMNGALVVIPAGCLDSEVTFKPQGHIFIHSKANWDNELDQVPKFDKFPE